MHVFIAGICGTFMAGIALIARELGYRVRGCDANVYPPMSDQLRAAGIEVESGYDPLHLADRPDIVIIGNALSRGNALVEFVLDRHIPYISGPQWLYENVLSTREVIAVSGTHGKTTTCSMVAWLLECADVGSPGFLIGGVPANFGVSARLGQSGRFVIEADEYDTAFFDKRSKFVHYRPQYLIINNIEYDHADIFPDIASIQRQFHHLVRTVPRSGCIVHPRHDAMVTETLAMGCWSAQRSYALGDTGADWQAQLLRADGSEFTISRPELGVSVAIKWDMLGTHNVCNALAAVALASECGIEPDRIGSAFLQFQGVKRRLEKIAEITGVTIYDDFAHHPTAIETTLAGLRASASSGRIIAVIEPRSNTMRLGSHQGHLQHAVRDADKVYWFQPAGVSWDIASAVAADGFRTRVVDSTQGIIDSLVAERRPGDRVVIMSNGGFEGIHRRLETALRGVGI